MALLNEAEQDRRCVTEDRPGFCIAVFDGADAERAGDKGILNATPSAAIRTETICLVEANILRLHFKLARIAGAHIDRHVGPMVKAKVAISYL
jgi:hypothetical protein